MNNPARGLFIGLLLSLLFWIPFLLWLGGCSMTPQQEALFYTPHDTKTITATELAAILPQFATINDGDYKLVPRGLVKNSHDAPWCAPSYGVSTLSGLHQPKDWTCVDYSESLAAKMQTENYAFGTASGPYKTRLYDSHMVNIFVDEDMEIVLYDPQTCQFVRMPIDSITM